MNRTDPDNKPAESNAPPPESFYFKKGLITVNKQNINQTTNMTKAARVIEKLGRRVRDGEWSDSLPPVTVLSEQFGVSPGTISLAVRSLEREGLVNIRPRQGVFVTRQAAPRPSTKPTIGLRGSYILKASGGRSIHAHSVLTSILEAASHLQGPVLMLPGTDDAPLLTPDACEQQGVKGMIFLGGENKEAMALRLAGFPVIVANKPVGLTAMNFIDYDHASALREVVGRFAEAGHRRIAVLFPDATTPGRFQALKPHFIEALCEADIYYNPKAYWRFVQTVHSTPSEAESVEAAIHALLDLPEPPTAIFCERSSVAEEALHCLKSRGVFVPKDISIACSPYNNEEEATFSGFVSPHATLAHELLTGLYATIGSPFHIAQKEIPLRFVERGTLVPVT